MARVIASETAEIKQEVRAQVVGKDAVIKKSFLRGFTAKGMVKDTKRLPALYVNGSRIP